LRKITKTLYQKSEDIGIANIYTGAQLLPRPGVDLWKRATEAA
jgi:hypothetical protein